jgi:hypothetical protein
MLPRVCIPSYNRPDLLKSKTLAFLETSGYPSNLIFVFVSDKSEFERYSQTCPGYNLVIGLPGLKPQRKFISDWLNEDEIYLGLDDDIDGVKTLGSSFLDLIRDACGLIGTRRSGLWGILPKDDGRCFKDDTTEHLSFIIGCLFVCRNHKEIVLEGFCLTDDYERSMLYFIKYGVILRYRGAGVQTKYKGTSGDANQKGQAVSDLISRFPKMCKYRDKQGEPDLLLNWRFNPSSLQTVS